MDMTMKDYVNWKMSHDVKYGEAEGYPLILEKCRKNKDLKNFRVYGESIQSILPSEYQQVEYIESTGTQYIDTAYIPTANTMISVEFKTNKISGEAAQALFGTEESSSSKRLYLSQGSANNIVVNIPRSIAQQYYLNSDGTFTANADSSTNYWYTDKVIYSLDIPNKKVSIGNKDWDLSTVMEESPVDSVNSLYLLARNSGNSVGSYAKGLLYGATIYENSTLVINMIPCYRKSDGVIGLYDLVNNVFYANSGSGTFLKGDNFVTPPTPEAPIEIQSVGELTTKNLLDVNTVYTNYANNEGGITFCNTDLNSVGWTYMSVNWKANTQYTFSANYEITNSDNNSVFIRVDYTDDTQQSFWHSLGSNFTGNKSGKGSATTEAGKTVKRMYIGFTTQTRTIEVKLTNMQVEEGSTATEYEPYHKYKIPVTVRGKNLLSFDLNNLGHNPGILSMKSFMVSNLIKFRPGTYTLSYSISNATTYRLYWVVFSDNGETELTTRGVANAYAKIGIKRDSSYDYGYYNGTNKFFMLNSNTDVSYNVAKITVSQICYIGFYVGSGDMSVKSVVTEQQLESSEVKTEYEPYVEPQTFNIFLDEPLRKVGDYADYVDFDKDEVVRQIGVSKFTNFVAYPNSATPNTYWAKSNVYSTKENKAPILTEYYPYSGCSAGYAKIAEIVYANRPSIGKFWTTSGYEGGIFISDDRFTIAKDLNTWIESNNVLFYYHLMNSLIQDITLPELPKTNAKTLIYEVIDTSVSPSNMYAKYIVKY